MSGNSGQSAAGAVSPVNETTIELVPGAELAIGVTAVPKTSLSLAASKSPVLKKVETEGAGGKKWQRLQLDLAFSGTGENLPRSLSCNVLCDIERKLMGVTCTHHYDAGAFSLEKGSDGKYSMSASIDVLTASLLGKGTVRFSLAPLFPHAPIVKDVLTYAFDLAVDLRLDGLAASPAVAEIGDCVIITPDIDRRLAELSGVVLRASIIERVETYFVEVTSGDREHRVTRKESRDEKQKENTVEVLVWRGELKARTWVVGTARQDAYRYLTCYKADEQGAYDFDVTLEASFDGGASFTTLWGLQELGRGVPVARPALESFSATVRPMWFGKRGVETVRTHSMLPPDVAREVVVQGEIRGLSKDLGSLRWNLAVTIWGARPIVLEAPADKKDKKADRPGQAPGTTSTRPRLAVQEVTTQAVLLEDHGRFELVFGLDRLPASEWLTKAAYPTYFATFSFDRQVTNTPEAQPITEIISVDSLKFRLAAPEDLLDGVTPGKAVAVLSEGLPGDPVCVPHVSSIRFSVEGENLVVCYHLAGEQAYWGKAKATYALRVEESGKDTVEIPLTVTAPSPHVRKASIALGDQRILGKEVDATVTVESPSAHDASQRLKCTPSLEGPIALTGQRGRDDGRRRLWCNTHYVPTHLDANTTTKQRLLFAFYEELADQRRIPLGYINPSYDLPSGTGGLVAPSGLFGAWLKDPSNLDEVLKKGKVLVAVESASPEGSVLKGMTVPPPMVVEGSSRARSVKGQLRFGKCVSAAFKKKLASVAGSLTTEGCTDSLLVADYLMTIMACETGGQFSPSIVNGIGAVGLIQFVLENDDKIREIADDPKVDPSNVIARLSGAGHVTVKARIDAYRDELKAMSAVQQLENVRNFLVRMVAPRKPKTLEDYYCCVFFPSAVGKPDSFVIGGVGSDAAKANPSLCVNGVLLKSQVCLRIQEWWTRGERYTADEDDDNPVAYKP